MSAKPQKRNDWFVNYPNIRPLQTRTQYFRQADFNKASVLDIGCNVGQMSIYAAEQKANKVIGVEFDQSAVAKARAALARLPQFAKIIEFRADDADSYFCFSSLPAVDVTLFLSVIDTLELTNRLGILARIAEKTKRVLYFEGHNNQPFSKYLKMLLQFTTFTQIEYLGQTFDKPSIRGTGRAFCRASRETWTSTQAAQYLYTQLLGSSHLRIAVVGLAGSGKTTIRRALVTMLGLSQSSSQKCLLTGSDFQIIDDLGHEKYQILTKKKKVILFDYRALVQMSDATTVILVHRLNQAKRHAEREGHYQLDRGPTGLENLSRVTSIYHVFVED